MLNRVVLVWMGFGLVLLVSALMVERVFSGPLLEAFGYWLVGLAVIQLGGRWSWLEEAEVQACAKA